MPNDRTNSQISPLERSGTNANITFYRESDPTREDHVWCEVLATPPHLSAEKIPTYSLIISRNRKGEIARCSYYPARFQPELPARTVTRLVRQAIRDTPGAS